MSDPVLEEYLRRAEILNNMWNVAKPRNTWGTINWLGHHLLTLRYPNTPTEEDKQAMRSYILSACPYMAWCAECRQHFQERTAVPTTEDIQAHVNERVEEALKDRVSLVTLFIDLHNAVNAETGKKQLTFDEFIDHYRNLPVVAHNIRAGLRGIVADPNNTMGEMSAEVQDVVRVHGAVPKPGPGPEPEEEEAEAAPSSELASSGGPNAKQVMDMLQSTALWLKTHSLLIFMTLACSCVLAFMFMRYIGPKYVWGKSLRGALDNQSVFTETTAPTLPVGR